MNSRAKIPGLQPQQIFPKGYSLARKNRHVQRYSNEFAKCHSKNDCKV